MTILVDWQIRDLVASENMISPFVETLTEKGVISYGLSSTGYDCRIGNEARIYSNSRGWWTDPKNMHDEAFQDVKAERGRFIIPPNSFMLASTVEYFRIPRWITMTIWNKSSYARSGIVCPGCVGEPGWDGNLTLEIANQTPLPAIVYAGEGIAQLQFNVHAAPELDYGQRKGKYQNQTGITLPRIKGE